MYSRTCYEQPATGTLVTAHSPRYNCIDIAIMGNGQVASHRRLAAHKSQWLLIAGTTVQVLLYDACWCCCYHKILRPNMQCYRF